MENPIKMGNLGVPLVLETPIYIYIYSTYIYRIYLSPRIPGPRRTAVSFPEKGGRLAVKEGAGHGQGEFFFSGNLT